MTTPVLSMALRKRVRKKSAGRKLGASSRSTSMNRKTRMVFCTLLRLSAPSLSRSSALRSRSLDMSGLNTYLPMRMKNSEQSTQMRQAMIMYFA